MTIGEAWAQELELAAITLINQSINQSINQLVKCACLLQSNVVEGCEYISTYRHSATAGRSTQST